MYPERIDGRGMGVIYAPETSNTTPGHREVRISKMAWMATRSIVHRAP
jgi:hypothetical protein